MKPYVTIAGDTRIELTFKRSRFIGSCSSIASEEHARQTLSEIRKEFWDATHNCSAYVTGENGGVARSSDDGEPSGTAGQPILDVLLGNKVTGVLIVVTRYFGGVLLGRGGLVQAYSKTAAQALGAAKTVLFEPALAVILETGYPLLKTVEAFLRMWKHAPLDTVYAENVTLELLIPSHTREAFQAGIVEATDARVRLRFGSESFHAFAED